MNDVQSRVVGGADGEVALYLFSDEKVDGGSSKRYAYISVEDGEACLMLVDRSVDTTDVTEVTMGTLGEAMLRAFAHVQR